MAEPAPVHPEGLVLQDAWGFWELGNPNRAVGTSKKVDLKVDLAAFGGVPPEEWVTIELTADYHGPNDRAYKANVKFVKFLNNVKNARIQIYLTAFEKSKKSKKVCNKGYKWPKNHEIVHMQKVLKKLMSQLDNFKTAVVQAGGTPYPVPDHFHKAIHV